MATKHSTETYADIQAQIEALQKRAEDARKREVAEVIDKIEEAIRVYGLTPADLNFGGPRRRGPGKKAKANGTPAAGIAVAKTKPRKVTSGSGLKLSATSRKHISEAAKKRIEAQGTPGVAKYKGNAEGQEWSGFGRKPGWFVEALAAGKTPEDLLVNNKG